jgi:hypothetical protein
MLRNVVAGIAAALAIGCSHHQVHHNHPADGSGATEDPAVLGAFRPTEEGRYRAKLEIDGGALRMGVNQLTLELRDPGERPVSGAAIRLEPWMPLHGHGAAVAPTVKEPREGVYRLEGIDLPMPGVWELRFEITVGSTRDRAVFGYFQAVP